MKISKKRIDFVFGQDMKACPKCNSYNLKSQAPIKIELSDEDLQSPKRMLGKWAQAHRNGPAMLEGPVYIMCFDCFHKGPAVDCSGRTSESVNRDKKVYAETIKLWNEQGGEA